MPETMRESESATRKRRILDRTKRFVLHEENGFYVILDMQEREIGHWGNCRDISSMQDFLRIEMNCKNPFRQYTYGKEWTNAGISFPKARARVSVGWFCRCEDHPERQESDEECTVCGSVRDADLYVGVD